MQQSFETEVLGFITKEDFDRLRAGVEKELGKPEVTNRLALQVSDFARRTLDTRIRITNGKAEIMQKVGDWDATEREEISVALPLDPVAIFGHWRVLDNLLDAPSVQKNIIQMECYLYKTASYEVKFTHQTGRQDSYNFEVESFDPSVDLVAVCKQFGLEPDLNPKDAAFWAALNERINLHARDLTPKQILDIISQHCTGAV